MGGVGRRAFARSAAEGLGVVIVGVGGGGGFGMQGTLSVHAQEGALMRSLFGVTERPGLHHEEL